jgi:hypothetical protein
MPVLRADKPKSTGSKIARLREEEPRGNPRPVTSLPMTTGAMPVVERFSKERIGGKSFCVLPNGSFLRDQSLLFGRFLLLESDVRPGSGIGTVRRRVRILRGCRPLRRPPHRKSAE